MKRVESHFSHFSNWKAGRMTRLIILNEDVAGENILKKLQEKGLVKVSAREKIKPLNKRRLVHITGESMSETVIRLRGEK